MARKLRALAYLLLPAAIAASLPADADDIAFDRPEAWAMKYFASVTTFTGLAAPRVRAPGAVEIGVEAGWVPHLSDDQRRVGFNGTSLEDLNKTSVFGRPRVVVGLPAGLSVEAAWVPPIEIHGGKASFFDGALEAAFLDAPGGSFGMRLYGQLGHAKGDYTCPEDVVANPPGSPGNPQGCTSVSEDVSTLNDAGVAVTGGVKLGSATLHAAVGAQYNDLQFQTGAYTNGKPDNTLLTTHGWTGWIAGGVNFALSPHFLLGAEAYYAPLTVVRPPSTESKNDGLFNVRGMVRWIVN